MGPLITPEARRNVEEKVREAVKEGAIVITGGKAMPDLGPAFFQPTVLTDVDVRSRLWRDETFGPVVAVRSFEDEDEAVRLANDTRSGLASYFCTRDLARAFRVAGR